MTRYPTLPTIKEAASLAVSWKRRARLSRVAGGGGEVSMRTGRRATRATKTPLPSPPDPPPPLIAMAAALPETVALPAAVPAASALPGASPPADRDPGSHLPWGSCVFAFVPCSSHPLADRPKHQYLRCSARTHAAQWISAFFTGLTWRDRVAKEGGCPNRLRITCGAGPLGAPSPLAGDTY